MNYLSRPLGRKIVLWLRETNRYMLVTRPAFSVIERLSDGQDTETIAAWCRKSYHLPAKEAGRFVAEIAELLEQELTGVEQPVTGNPPSATNNQQPETAISRYYSINGITFRVDYQTGEIAFWIHPQFAHLEIQELNTYDNHFQVFEHEGKVLFRVNGCMIGEWIPDEFISLLGKFYMEILNRIHGKTRSDWMAILHASAVSDGSRGIAFMGAVGHGKSTVSAILLANGFDLYADDFTPVDAATGHVWYFPAALSVKKAAVAPLISLFPQLEDAGEFTYPGTNKTVRYLPPQRHSGTPISSVPVKAIVFVRYKKDSGIKIKKIRQTLAFRKMIPGSWIAPEPDNVARFLDWFTATPCYELTYSDNEAMVRAVRELMGNGAGGEVDRRHSNRNEVE